MKKGNPAIFEVRFPDDQPVQGKDCWWIVGYTIKQVKHFMKHQQAKKANTKHALPRYDIVPTDLPIESAGVDFNLVK